MTLYWVIVIIRVIILTLILILIITIIITIIIITIRRIVYWIDKIIIIRKII